MWFINFSHSNVNFWFYIRYKNRTALATKNRLIARIVFPLDHSANSLCVIIISLMSATYPYHLPLIPVFYNRNGVVISVPRLLELFSPSFPSSN
jgi:hypothetical protein